MSGLSRYLGFGVTLVFVALLLWKVDLREVTAALASANYLWVAPAIATTVASYLLRTGRWGQILQPIRRVSFRALLPVLMIGFMANNLLPARIGELVRAYALGRKTGLSKSLGLATILLERLFDGVTLLAVLGLFALLFPLSSWGRTAGLFAGAVFLVLAVALVGMLTRQSLALRVLRTVSRPLPRGMGEQVERKAGSFIEGLRVLRHGRDLLAIVAWSLVIWSVECGTYFVVIRSVHPTLRAGSPLLAAMLMMVMVNLGTLIPSAPGYVGVYQFFGVQALQAFGVTAEAALAVAILAQAVQWTIVTGLGLIFVARESLDLRGLATEPAVEAGAADVVAGGAGGQ